MRGHLNPEMLIDHMQVHQMELKNFLQLNTWVNNQEQRQFLLEYIGE